MTHEVRTMLKTGDKHSMCAHIGRFFIGCMLYADDIVLMSPSCRGLQNLVSICERYGLKWNIKFNLCKSLWGINYPAGVCINLAGTAIQWTNEVMYLGVYFCSNSGYSEISDNIRKFYGRYDNIGSVLGYGNHEMSTGHLCKVYCVLPALMSGCESWRLPCNRISVAWNNRFRSIFNWCCRESVDPLQYFCQVPVASLGGGETAPGETLQRGWHPNEKNCGWSYKE